MPGTIWWGGSGEEEPTRLRVRGASFSTPAQLGPGSMRGFQQQCCARGTALRHAPAHVFLRRPDVNVCTSFKARQVVALAQPTQQQQQQQQLLNERQGSSTAESVGCTLPNVLSSKQKVGRMKCCTCMEGGQCCVWPLHCWLAALACYAGGLPF